MSEEARIEEIHDRLARAPVGIYVEDVSYLLKRVEELDVANLKLERAVHQQAEQMIEISEENHKLAFQKEHLLAMIKDLEDALAKRTEQLAEIQRGSEI